MDFNLEDGLPDVTGSCGRHREGDTPAVSVSVGTVTTISCRAEEIALEYFVRAISKMTHGKLSM